MTGQLLKKTMAHWEEKNKSLIKEFTCKSFPDAISFVQDIANEAERMQHHPDIKISYTRVEIILSTHDAGGVTEKDHALAKFIDSVYTKYI